MAYTYKDETYETEDEAIEKIVEELEDGAYDDYVDETYGDIVIEGITFNPSRILKELDPTARRCFILDMADSIARDEVEEVYEDELEE